MADDDMDGEGVIEVDPICELFCPPVLADRNVRQAFDISVEAADVGRRQPAIGEAVDAVGAGHDIGPQQIVPRVVIDDPRCLGLVGLPARPRVGLRREYRLEPEGARQDEHQDGGNQQASRHPPIIAAPAVGGGEFSVIGSAGRH